MKVVKNILIALLIIVVVLGGLSYIDYVFVKTKNSLPKIAIKSNNNDMTVYKALFYKVWECNSDGTTVIGDYSDPNPVCPSSYVFKDGYYTNSAGLNIKKRDLLLMTYNNIYTNEMIEIMSNQSEVDNAVYVAESYGKSFAKRIGLKEGTISGEKEEYQIVAFPTFVEKGDTYIWSYDEENEDGYYCVSKDDEDVSYSKYTNGYCEDNFAKYKMESKWCNLYQNTTLVYLEDAIKSLCEE